MTDASGTAGAADAPPGDPLAFRFLAPIVAAGTAVAATAGFFLGIALLLPLLACLPLWSAFAALVRQGRRAGAWGLVAVWAASLSLTLTGLTLGDPQRAARVISRGPEYAAEMGRWVDTGHGRETDPSIFVREQLLQAAAFSVLALASGGVLSLPLGAWLIGFMSYHVAMLMARSASPLLTLPAAWPPWALARVAAFAALQTVFAEPLLRRGQGPLASRLSVRLLLAAVAGLAADLVMKTCFAERWPEIIRATIS
jgi:hypothetical protein